MASNLIMERLRQALVPEYRVERELASGGMGSVFLAHEVALERAVAIKVMRPELGTARAAERFVREARILASLRHPNVVPVHRAGEAGGLFYYVMEYVDGETLEARLQRGPLPAAAALKLGRDLLDGLEAAHQAGVIHRDLKPANILLVGRRALLVDFGIARGVSRPTGAPSTEGRLVGTPGYMPPEQAAGAEVTPQTDLYAAAAVLYEAFTGRRWPFSDEADWSGVPRPVARVLQRALAWSPAERCPDAGSFRRALWRTRTRRYARRTALLTASGLVVGVAGTVLLERRGGAGERAGGSLRIVVHPFAVAGAAPVTGIGDSLAVLLRTELAGHPDFQVTGGGDRPASRGPTLALAGRVELDAGFARARLVGDPVSGRDAPLAAEARVPRDAWTTLADSLAYSVLLGIWNAQSPLAASLPLRALPRTTAGLAAFLSAERLVAAARWGEAYTAYMHAEAVDSTCWLCSWRLNDIERWLGREHDVGRTRRYLAHVDSFPPAYQSLIRAAGLPLAARLDTLRAASRRWRDFFLLWFQLGDELFHRGSLVGHRRSEAVSVLQEAGRLRPDFAPTWEHLAWALVAEGDSAGAAAALAALARTGTPRDPVSQEIRGLLRAGFAWRFLPPAAAAGATARELEPSAIAEYPDLAAGPRLLPTFDAPRGAMALGAVFAGMRGRADLERSGLIAQTLGAVAVGDPARARAGARALKERFSESEIALFAAELEGALALVDSAGGAPDAAVEALGQLAARGAGPDAARRRAAWMRALLLRRARAPSDGRPSPDAAASEPAPRPLATLLAADSAGARGQWTRALDLSDGIAVDTAARQVDPFFRTVARLLRAGWYERLGNVEAARRELRWHEHEDVVGSLTGPPQASEIDWAFGTFARWRRARLLDHSGETGSELCGSYQAVARHWRTGSALYAARADSARRRLEALGCGR